MPAFEAAGLVDVSRGDSTRATVGGHLLSIETVPITRANETVVDLPSGGSVGFLYDVPAGRRVHHVRVLAATYKTTDSAFTLTCRRDGPTGAVLCERRFVNAPDNTWARIDLPDESPRRIWVGMSDRKGRICWWAAKAAPPAGVSTLIDGRPTGEFTLCAEVELHQRVLPVVAEWRLEGNVLSAEIRPVGPPVGPVAQAFTWHVRTRWVKDGYEVSPATAAFECYYTSAGQFVTAHQLKRREHLGLPIGPAEHVVARGTEGADIRLSGGRPRLDITCRPDGLTHEITVGGASPAVGSPLVVLRVAVEPTPKRLPPMFPVFAMSDARAGELTTRFFWDRALSYPPSPGPSAWYEWSGLIRNWLDMPLLRDPERDALAANPITPDGYVHTWGATIGWPFPDGAKYDTRHFDSNARFILGVYRWVTWRRDKAFLCRQLERVRKAMAYQLFQLQGEGGLIISNSKDNTGRPGSLGGNYWDILPFGHKDAYCNIAFYASLRAMAELEYLAQSWCTPEERNTSPLGRSPRAYMELARLAKMRFNETFWDESTGRYIGCVDIDGVRRDYGFTFVNLEAMAYGLADTEQAKRIYHWMENEPTSTGKPDTYTAFLFAPRATTFHNPIRNDPADIQRAGRPSWWHMDWNGTPFGDQCQDGGAILYTSYYDILARATLLGADNAWRRYRAILDRYQMPDRLCGGPPLSRGEIPQQENPGQVGVDLPFPESGLVPASVLYAFMGVMPDALGLSITPRLPGAIEWMQCGPVCIGPARLTIRVDSQRVTITGNSGDRPINLAIAYTAGAGVRVFPQDLYSD